ncbi:MAG: methyltransferase domain-containing protein [Ilumatobacteraceae bacterium]
MTTELAADGPVFDAAAAWRADVIRELGLRGAERSAAASPMAGFPQLLDFVSRTLGAHAPRRGAWIDVGAGLGGVADWIKRTTRHETFAFEPAPGSVDASRRLFPLLPATQAVAACLPLRTGCVGAVMVNGVVSLLDDLDGLFDEVSRVVRPDGVVAVADLWSTTDTTLRRSPNVFWSMEELVQEARGRGFELLDAATCTVGTGWWQDAAIQVAEVIRQECRDRPGFDAWEADQRHIAEILDDSLVMPGACSFRRRSSAVPAPEST